MDFQITNAPINAVTRCPLCGSEQFDVQPPAADGSFVTQICAACGLTCRVVIGPESPSLGTLSAEWAAVFAHD